MKYGIIDNQREASSFSYLGDSAYPQWLWKAEPVKMALELAWLSHAGAAVRSKHSWLFIYQKDSFVTDSILKLANLYIV